MTKISRRKLLQTSLAATGAVAASHMAANDTAASNKAAVSASQKTFTLTRQVPVETGFDLVVAGGGPAGAAAAICAARQGVKVLLVEAAGSLGGMGSNGYVSNWYALRTGDTMLVGGLTRELIEKLCRKGRVFARPSTKPVDRIWAIGFDPEMMKLVLDELCREANVEVRFFTKVIDVDANQEKRTVHGVVTHSVEGYRYIQAPTFVDATGDAVLADLCGAASREAGRDTPNIMPPTLCARIANINTHVFDKKKQQTMVEKAIEDGFFTQPDRHVPGMFRSDGTSATMNAGHLFHTNALKTRSLSDAMVLGRKLAQEYAEFYRKYMPGCENIEVMATGALMGVRESRRIVGEYELDYDDFKARRQFPDQIAVYCKGVDIHVYDLSAEEYERYHQEFTDLDRLKRGESYGIPYGILVPKGWTNLWVAGRCNSSDIKVHGAIRDQPACSMMGQAAGTAAVQSLRTGQAANELDTEQLVHSLRKAGAYLPQEETAKFMTRST